MEKLRPIEQALIALLEALKGSEEGRALLRQAGLVVRDQVQPIYQAALLVRNRYYGFRSMAACGTADPKPLQEAVHALARLIDQYEEKRHETADRPDAAGRTEQARARAQSKARRR